MDPFDARAGIDAESRECRWCGNDFWLAPSQLHRPPAFCSDVCRKAAHALRESERRQTLRSHGLCQRCKRPL